MSNPHGSADLTRPAARLLDGAGMCTFVIRGSKNPADALTALDHRRVGDSLRLVCLPAPDSTLATSAVGRSIVVVIDEFAPGVTARVHVASLHARATITAARTTDDGDVVLDVELGDLAVSRLGSAAVYSPRQLVGVIGDPVADEADSVAGEVLARFAAELAAFCGHCMEDHADAAAASAPIVLSLDAAGMDVLAQTTVGAQVSRVNFHEPAETADAAVREIARAVGYAA